MSSNTEAIHTRQPVPPAFDCWYLTGPTASGKTKVGVELALRLNAEIVSLDSMTLYRGMDIGTAKPSDADRVRVPHHLLDVVDPNEDFSLSEYIDAAHEKIAEIKSRGKEVLFVGGTPLYLKSLLRGVYQGPPADWKFREQIERELKTLPPEALHQRLQVIDPLMAAKLHVNDKRRIIRGLEVFKLTGQRLSHLQTQFDEGRPATKMKVFVLTWPRDALHQRIDARVEQMFAAGLVEEVRGLVAKYGTFSRTALQAVGYREVLDLLSPRAHAAVAHIGVETELAGASETNPGVGAGAKRELIECIDRVKARTRQFARRQETWFRSLTECTPVAMQAELLPADVAARIAAADSHRV